MSTPNQSRRTWIMTIRRFAEVAWTRHGPTRYVSVALTPALVAVLVPGLWWVPCAIGAAFGILIDLRIQKAFGRLAENVEQLDDAALPRAIGRHVAALAAITACYVAPYSVLAFAPQPAPVIGLLFCGGAALICATLHVMTRTMIFYTVPTILIGLTLNAAALGEGINVFILGAMALLLGFNAIVAARAGAKSFLDLICARQRAEEAAETLEQRVKERTAQLAIATKRAQAANKAKSMFLANMSHELRTPLNAVIGYAEIVEEDVLAGETATSAADLVKIRNSANHLLTLINEVLDLSRIEAGKLDLHAAHLPVASLLREALDTIAPLANKNSTRCTLAIGPDVSTVFADETRMRQCVLNLLSNAAKFTKNGTVQLDVRRCKIGADPGIAIAVRDTGRGIAPDDLQRLFQPFVQADASKTRTHDGAGLGLAITRRLARAMGGDVTASSELGKGSVFTLYLPTQPAAQRAAA